jgi:hypothetical protein
MSTKEIHEDFMDTLGKASKAATNDETAEAVHDLVMCDRRRNLQSIARDVSISFSSGNSD